MTIFHRCVDVIRSKISIYLNVISDVQYKMFCYKRYCLNAKYFIGMFFWQYSVCMIFISGLKKGIVVLKIIAPTISFVMIRCVNILIHGDNNLYPTNNGNKVTWIIKWYFLCDEILLLSVMRKCLNTLLSYKEL